MTPYPFLHKVRDITTRNLIDYIKKYDEYKELNNTKKQLRKKIQEETGKSEDEYRSQKIKIEKRIDDLEKILDDYKFLEKYKDIEKRIEDLTIEINDKLNKYHALNRKLKKIKSAFEIQGDIDSDRIQELYNESIDTFGDLIKKKLDEVMNFKEEIVENRKKFLLKKQTDINDRLNAITSDISKLEDERSRLYKYLDEGGALDSIKNTYEQLVVERTDLERNLQSLNQIDSINSELSEIDVEISEIRRDIINDIDRTKTTIDELRRLFQEILANAIFLDEEYEESYFDISIRSSSRRDWLPFEVKVNIPKAEALGQNRLEIVAYDLMVFLHNIENQRTFPKFLVHDGVFHGIAKNTIINTLNFIHGTQVSGYKSNNFNWLANRTAVEV